MAREFFSGAWVDAKVGSPAAMAASVYVSAWRVRKESGPM